MIYVLKERIFSGQGYRERLCRKKRRLKEKCETQEQEKDYSRKRTALQRRGTLRSAAWQRKWLSTRARGAAGNGWRAWAENLLRGPERKAKTTEFTGKNVKPLKKACEQFCHQNCALSNTSCKIINRMDYRGVRKPDKGIWKEMYKIKDWQNISKGKLKQAWFLKFPPLQIKQDQLLLDFIIM